jgi:hypothetical protein
VIATNPAVTSGPAIEPLTARAGRWYCLPLMQTIADASDGDLARAVANRTTGSAEAAEGELYRRFAPRVRLYGLRHLRDLWATPGALVRSMPSMRLRLTLTSTGASHRILGEYLLDHTASHAGV